MLRSVAGSFAFALVAAWGCQGESPTVGKDLPEGQVRAAGLGSPCVTEDEYDVQFGGHALNEVLVDTDTAACASGVCLVHHFQGRASCPYGNVEGASHCWIPNSNVEVEARVKPVLLDRPPEITSICSCHCAGPGAQ